MPITGSNGDTGSFQVSMRLLGLNSTGSVSIPFRLLYRNITGSLTQIQIPVGRGGDPVSPPSPGSGSALPPTSGQIFPRGVLGR